MAAADLNGDGNTDLVTANHGASGTVSVLLGKGDGTFGVRSDFGVGSYPVSIAIGDLNGDGKPDLAVANQTNTVSVLLGNGDGTFGAKTDFGTGSSPSSVAMGDLNDDAKPDLAVTNSGSSTVSVLLGNGDGSFGARTDFGTGAVPSSVAIGDLNGDAKPDLAVADKGYHTADPADGMVSVLLGNGDGSFGARTDVRMDNACSSVAIGDLNGDGKPDLVVGAETEDLGCRLLVLLGDGNGSFEVKGCSWTGPSHSVAIGDLNGDGIPDLAVANIAIYDWPYLSPTVPGDVSVLLGNGDGTFGARTDVVAGSSPYCVAMRDLNGDGHLDLAVANEGSSAVSVLLGNGDATFGQQAEYGATDPYSVAIGDLNTDNILDLAVANTYSHTVSVLLGNGDGSFGVKTDYGTGGSAVSVAISDLNGDGRPDLVVSNAGSNTVSVLLGSGDGSFGANTDFGTGDGPGSVAIGDLNGDGKLDLAVANTGSGTVSVLLGNGDGSFGAKADIGTGTSPSSVAIGDLNGDAKLDLTVTNQNSMTVSVLLGNGDGTFAAKSDRATGLRPISVTTSDLNGDGRLDMVVANCGYLGLYTPDPGPDSVSVFLGNGDGSFGPRTDYVTGFVPIFVAVGDLSGDGRPDLAVANRLSNTVSVLLGDGQGNFGGKTEYGTGLYPSSVAIGDLNGDGRLDLAATNSGAITVSVLLNTGDIPTPMAIALVGSRAMPGLVEIRWYGASMAGVTATVYRRFKATAWSPIAGIAGNGTGTLRFEDTTVQPSTRYGYRLGVRESGTERFYGETWVDVPSLTLALEGLRPNPAVGELVASFTLPNGSPARLQVLDVAGRVWLAREVGDLGAGSHLLRLGGAVPAGIYWLRLTQGGRSLLARGVVVR